MNNHITIDIQETLNYFTREDFFEFSKKLINANNLLKTGTGQGNEFLGWLKLPSAMSPELLDDINSIADEFKSKVDYVVVTGIGGSYLGARAITEALSDNFAAYRSDNKYPKILFAGQNISGNYLNDLISLLKGKRFAIVVISKSGTTTEPALAFRVLKNELERCLPENEVRNFIIAVTDKEKGALRTLAEKEGYKTFVIPDDVGGRFSVLTPVGLLPVAMAGFDIKKLISGALFMENLHSENKNIREQPAGIYAMIRNILYDKGYTNEIMANYNPKLHFITEWWKQLYGESEGKENKGIFPAGVDLTTDLHSLGQYIQDGKRNLFETVITVEKPQSDLEIPYDKDNLDKLNYLAGKSFDYVNKMAEKGTTMAHLDGGVPVININIPELNEYYLGQLIYFFEIGCALSGYILGVNPFDQPGVEAYKSNMFRLLGKPGN